MGNTCTNPILGDRRTETNILSFESYLREKNRHVPQVGHIKLLTYNIFIRPPMISNNGDDYKDERLEEFAKQLKNYDIVCLQEMFSSYSNRKEQLVEKAKEAGLLFSFESPKVATFSAHFIDGGLLILSRYPIVASEFCPYPLGIGADYYVNKGALYAKIKIANSYLHLYTTHAQASYDLNPKYFLKRAEQFVMFQKFIKESLAANNYTDEDLVLLTGDFNVDGRSQYRFVTQEYISDPLFQGSSSLARTSLFSEYEALVNCLSDDNKDELEDLLYKKLGEHPITFGDYYVTDKNERKPKDKVLTHCQCLCADESLDYIFKYVPKSLSSDPLRSLRLNVKQKLIVREENTGVDRFFVHGHDFDQLSDHYGVTVTLECIQNERDKEEAETVSGSAYENESPVKITRMG